MSLRTSILFMFLASLGFATLNVSLSSQGTDVTDVNGTILSTGNLSVYIYDAETSGNLIWSELFEDAIVNGSWNVRLTEVPLAMNVEYWQDYEINSDNIDFDGDDRLPFHAPLGSVSWSDIENEPDILVGGDCAAGEAIQNISTGGIECIAVGGGGPEVDPWWTANETTVARTGSCAANQYATASTTSGLTCTQPSTTQVTEGTNLYYTDARARGALSNTAPITYNSGTGAIGITQSATGADGYLSSTDWNTFNGKESVLTFSTGLNRATNTITLKNAAAAEIGGVKSLTCSGTDKLSAIGTDGLPVCSTDQTGGGGSAYNRTVYTSTGANVWTKPVSGSMVRVEIWAGGGSGGRGGAADAGGGGGGGGYMMFERPFADFSSTQTCTVGAGGAARTTDEANGNPGAITTMTVGATTYTVYGGGGGYGATTADGGGGGGGGIWGVGQVGAAAAGGLGGLGCGAAGAGTAAGAFGDVCGGGGGTTNGGWAYWGGGGGGYGQDTGTAYSGGRSMYGGGGGGGGDGAGAPEGTGGISIFGGNGGAGATGANAATAGSQPGGGGGGSVTGNSGKGGDGQCIITVY